MKVILCILLASIALLPVDRSRVCTSQPQAGTVAVTTDGITGQGKEEFAYPVPFCTANIVIVATVNNATTPGERVGAQSISASVGAVSVWTETAAQETLTINWIAMP